MSKLLRRIPLVMYPGPRKQGQDSSIIVTEGTTERAVKTPNIITPEITNKPAMPAVMAPRDTTSELATESTSHGA